MRVRPIAIIALLLSGAPLRAETPLKIDVIEHRFPNGLTLLMLEHHRAPIVSCLVSYRVGSVNEEPGHTGISHLLEHMMFKGTRTIGAKDYAREEPLIRRIEELHEQLDKERDDPESVKRLKDELTQAERQADSLTTKNEFWKILARVGAEGLNAGTGRDCTQYYCSLPANRLELWMWLESDRMRNAVFREFYRERAVVLEERRLGIDDSPHGVFGEQLLASAFIAHPYRWPVIGWASDIEHITPDMLRSFHRRYYAPNNAIVVIAGDIQPLEVITLADRYFGPIPSQPPPPPVVTLEPEQRGKRETRLALDASARIALVYHKPAVGADDNIALNVLEKILSSGRTSRLYKSLVQEKQVAVAASASCPPAKYPYLFIFYAIPRRPHTTEQVERALLAEIEKLSREPASEWEMQKARNQIEADFVRGCESVQSLASLIGNYESIYRWEYINSYIPKIRAVTAQDVTRVVNKYLREENCTKAVIDNSRLNSTTEARRTEGNSGA
jgi:predicted Zn-dependent peptidase